MRCSLDGSSAIVLLCGVYVSCLWGSTVRCYTLFYDSLVEDFEVDYAAASLISSLAFVGVAAGSGLCGSMFKLFGYSNTVIAWGVLSCISILLASFSSDIVLTALGVGLIPGFALAPLQISTMAIANTLDQKVANFFAQMFYLGVSVGPFLLCPCFQYFNETYGWRGALQIIAGLFLNLVVCGVAMRRFRSPRRDTTNKLNKHREKRTLFNLLSRLHKLLDMKLFADPSFYAYVIASSAFCSLFFSALSYLPLYGTKVLNLDMFVATTLVSALSVGDGVAKILFSLLSGRIRVEHRILCSSILISLVAGAVLLLSLSRSYLAAMVASTAVGLFGGGISGLRSITPNDVFGQKLFSSAFGYCCTIAFGAASVTQYLIGMLISSTDNLSLVYYIGVGLGLCAAAFELFWHLHFYRSAGCRKRATKAESLDPDSYSDGIEVT